MVKKVYIVDIDNTVYDAESRLHVWFPEFDPLAQVSYNYADKKYLMPYSEPTFYSPEFVNNAVVSFVKQQLVNSSVLVMFASQSPSDEVDRTKINLLKGIFGNDTSAFAYMKMRNLDDSLTQKESELKKFARVVKLYGSENVIFVDDNPDRLAIASELGCKYITVEHPYNRNLSCEGMPTLLPNYYKGWEVH